MTKKTQNKKNRKRNLHVIVKDLRQICLRKYKIRLQAYKDSKPKDQEIVDMMGQCKLNNG